MRGPVKVAVVGHTNTGKTSLLRTLTRDVDFGEVSDHPAVTRHVEGTELLVDGRAVMELYDTPGLEDSIGLLAHLDELARDGEGRLGIEIIERFLESPAARGAFVQEAKALRQLLACDVALYVIDVRDPVLGKHRDELEILGRCSRPVVPVLNFVAADDARTDEWRNHLGRANLHAVASFDTVLFDETDERRLLEKMQSLLDAHADAFTALIEDRRTHRSHLVALAARVLADLLLDVAAYTLVVPNDDDAATRQAVETMQSTVRQREQRCLDRLLELFEFRPDDGRLAELPIEDGRWGLDLFAPEAMKRFGVRAGGAAAAGAMAGLAVDVMFAGVSLGAATATGAALGALLETGRSWGRKLSERARGLRELRCNDDTLLLLLARQLELVRALLRRGHAAIDPVVVGEGAGGRHGRRDGAATPIRKLPAEVLRARTDPKWSRLGDTGSGATARSTPAAREAAESALADRLEPLLATPGQD